MPPNKLTDIRLRFAPLMWALLVSVILNLFLVGALLGYVPHNRPPAQHSFGPMLFASPHGQYLADWMIRYLNSQDAAAFHDIFNAQSAALEQSHVEVREAIAELADVYKKDPPDAAAMQTALDHLTAARQKRCDIIKQILQATYMKISPEGRQRLADLAQNPQ